MEKPCMDVYHHIGDLERANAWSFELLCLALLWDFFFLNQVNPFIWLQFPRLFSSQC